MFKYYRSTIMLCLVSASFTGCAGGGSTSIPAMPNAANTTSGSRAGSSLAQSAKVARLTVSAQASGIAIDAGGASAASGWVADADYAGGGLSTSAATVSTSHVTNPAPQAVYQTQRYGSTFSYAIPGLTPNATYTVRLHFAETFFTSAGQRVFNATINGTPVLSNFDIYKSAGGSNIAIAESFSAKATTSGTISIGFSAAANYPSLGGIEISVPPSSVTGPTAYPIYSTAFTGNTPFHHTVAQLVAAGATVRSSAIARNFWAQGLSSLQPGSQTGGEGPLYTVKSGDPGYTFGCPSYGSCNAKGLVVHYPGSATPESGTDHHIASFDAVYIKGEVDGWGGDGNANHACALHGGSPGAQTCSWGGFFPFSGSGLATDYSSANAAGYAQGLMLVTAGELLQGHIDHALGIDSSCLDNGGVYPAIAGRSTDSACPSGEEPNARYGDLVHLKSSVNIAALGYSQYCAVIAQALQKYGAYTADTNGGWGVALGLEYMDDYTGVNPWFQTIFPSLVKGNDGSGSGPNFSFKSCLGRIPASDIEVLDISPKLPQA